jgi:hypothetical protein
MEYVSTTQLFRAAGYSGAVDPQLNAGWLLALPHQAAGVDAIAIGGPPSIQAAHGARHNPTVTVGGLTGESVFGSSGNGSPGPPSREAPDSTRPSATSTSSHRPLSQPRHAGVHVMSDLLRLGHRYWKLKARTAK